MNLSDHLLRMVLSCANDALNLRACSKIASIQERLLALKQATTPEKNANPGNYASGATVPTAATSEEADKSSA